MLIEKVALENAFSPKESKNLIIDVTLVGKLAAQVAMQYLYENLPPNYEI